MGNSILKKMSIALASALVATQGFAAMDMDSRVSSLESQVRDIRTETANGRFGAKNASAQPNIQGSGWFANADLLYWKACSGGMDYAYTNSSSPGLPIKGNMKTVDSDFSFGFRLGLGYVFQRDGWDFHATGTWFSSKNKDYASSGPGTVLVPDKTFPFAAAISPTTEVTTVSNAGGKYYLNFRTLDFELGRAYFVSKFCAVRPHMGVEVAWLKQKSTFSFSGQDLGNEKVHLGSHDHFTGAGLRTGAEMMLGLGKGFCILGRGAAALIYGDHKVEYKANKSELPGQSVNLEANVRRFVPNVQLFLGFGYEQNMNTNKNHVSVSLGYETQYWWRANQMIDFANVTASALGGINNMERMSEDLCLQGVTLDLRFDF